MKTLLCTIPLNIGVPRDDSESPIMPKIAIVSLIKWMECHGYTREEYDFYDIDMLDSSDDEIQQYIESYKPSIVGLSAVVSTSYAQVKRIAKIVRQICPDSWIVMGGNLSASANVVLRKTAVDICVQGDGEIPWVNFLDYVKRHGKQWDYQELLKIKGLSFIDDKSQLQFTGYGDPIPAEDNPFPDYDILALGLKQRPKALKNYFRNGLKSALFQHDQFSHDEDGRVNIACFWVSKGCVGRCAFCQRSTSGYRLFDLKALDEHLDYLKKQHNVGFVQLIDENFGTNKKHAYEVADLMKKHGMIWVIGGARCTSFNAEDVKFYHNSGCSGIKFGLESGSQKILDLMQKMFTVEQVREAIKHCVENKIYSPCAVMIGMPGETNETVKQTGRLLGEIADMQGIPPARFKEEITTFYALPLPGAPLYEYGTQVGVLGTSVDEEEEYLESVSAEAAGRSNYINLNGSSMKKVLFWETLVRLEANRVFSERQKKNPRTVIHERWINDKDARSSSSKTSSLSLSGVIGKIIKNYKTKNLIAISYNKISYSTLKGAVNSSFIARLPRFIADIFLSNIIYGIFWVYVSMTRVMHSINKRREHDVRLKNLYKRYRLPRQIKDSELSLPGKQFQRSLRNIVKAEREKKSSSRTLTEKNRQILMMGR